MIIAKKTIFYFSGTGNSLQVAKDISELIGDTELISITGIISNKEIIVESEYIGLIFPVYMGGLPLLVENFIKKLKLDKKTYIFAVSTFGGMAGDILKQVNDILVHNGTKLNSGINIKMPGNYIAMYGARSNDNQINAFQMEKVRVKDIADIINRKENNDYEKSKSLIGKIIAPIMRKRLNEVNTKDKMFSAQNNCTGCGVCAKICGVNNIEVKDGKPMWKNQCQQCMACIQYCPNQAIEYGKRTIGRKRYRNPNIELTELLNK